MNFRISIPGRSANHLERPSLDDDDLYANRESQLKSYSNTFCVSNSENCRSNIIESKRQQVEKLKK